MLWNLGRPVTDSERGSEEAALMDLPTEHEASLAEPPSAGKPETDGQVGRPPDPSVGVLTRTQRCQTRFPT